MEFDVLLLNAIVYIATTIFHWWRRGKFDIYLLLWTAYSFVAFMGWYIVVAGIYGNDTRLGYKLPILPYICCYISTFLLTYLFRNINETKIKKVFIRNKMTSSLIIVLTVCFIVQGVLNSINIYVITNTIGYGEAYELGHHGISSNIWQNNQIASKFLWISNFITKPLQPIYIIYFINRLINKRGNKIYLNLLCIAIAFWPQLTSSVSSKGSLFFATMDVVFYYILFKNKFPQIVKKRILMIGGLFIAFLFLYVTTIQIVRLDYDRTGVVSKNDAYEVMTHYMGEAFPNLGTVFYGHIKEHPMGHRFYPYLFVLSENSEDSYKGGQAGMMDYWSERTGVQMAIFKTFWGDFYIEFGLVGSFLGIIGLLLFFYFICFKEYWRLSKLPILLYFYHYIAVWSLFTAEGQQGSDAFRNLIIVIIVGWIMEKNLKTYRNKKIRHGRLNYIC